MRELVKKPLIIRLKRGGKYTLADCPGEVFVAIGDAPSPGFVEIVRVQDHQKFYEPAANLIPIK